MTTPSTTRVSVTDDVGGSRSVTLLCPTCQRRLGAGTLVGEAVLAPGGELFVSRYVLRRRRGVVGRRFGRSYKDTVPAVWTCRNGHRLSLDRDHLLGLLDAFGRDGTGQSYLRAAPSVSA